LSFTPLVPNQPIAGYTLAGARIDQLTNLSVATVVYRSGSHLAEIFQWPNNGSMTPSTSNSQGGLNVSSWTSSGWGFVAVSDATAPPTAGLTNIFTVQGCQ
jgi:anti-sigma factor RsiW